MQSCEFFLRKACGRTRMQQHCGDIPLTFVNVSPYSEPCRRTTPVWVSMRLMMTLRLRATFAAASRRASICSAGTCDMSSRYTS